MTDNNIPTIPAIVSTSSDTTAASALTPPRGANDPPEIEEVAAPTDPKEIRKMQIINAMKNATMAHFDGAKFVIRGLEIPLKELSVPVGRAFCNRKINNIRFDDGKTFRGAKKHQIEDGIKLFKRRMDAGEETRPWTVKEQDGSKAVSVNRIRMGNVFYGDAMKEPCATRGTALKKNDMITSLAASKTGDQPFFMKAMEEYNDVDNVEYKTLQFADDITVDANNLPHVFTQLTDWRDLKKAFKSTTAELDKARQSSKLSGRNDSDDEEEEAAVVLDNKNKKYILYWNLLANGDQDRFRSMNRELPDSVYSESGTKGKP